MTRLRCQLPCYFVLSPLWDVQIYDVITSGLEVIHYKSTAPIKGSSLAASAFYCFFLYTMVIIHEDKDSQKTFHSQEEADLYNKSHRLIKYK